MVQRESRDRLDIRRFECLPEKMVGLSIFRLVEDSNTFVSQLFVDRVEQQGLRGFDFVRLWPLPPGVSWKNRGTEGDRVPAPEADAPPAATGDEPLDEEAAGEVEEFAADARALLGFGPHAEPAAVVKAIDDFAWDWQRGRRPAVDLLEDEEEARLLLGTLWGEQLVLRLGWRWARVGFEDGSSADGVVSPDRSLAVFPFEFLLGCLSEPDVDVTVALSFNMLVSGGVPAMPPRSYTDVMAGVRRIVPRD